MRYGSDSEVLVFDPPHTIVWRSKPVGERVPYHRWAFVLEPTETGTRLTNEVNAYRAGGLQGWVQRLGFLFTKPRERVPVGMNRTLENVKRLADAGIVSGIKYAIVRADPARDEYLQKLVGLVDPRMIISGIGEQPAIAHLREFGLGGFTSGCVCVAPKLSTRMLEAMQAGHWPEAERIRKVFQPLEDLRNAINPIRVLHEAVRLAGIADTGPLLPLLSNVPSSDHPRIAEAAKQLLIANSQAN